MRTVYVCLVMYLLFLQVKSRPDSSHVSSAPASDMEAEGRTGQQRTSSMAQRKRAPEHADHERKRPKGFVSAARHSFDMGEIDRDVISCNEVNIDLLNTKEIEPEEVIRLLHSNICQCIADTLDVELSNIKDRIARNCRLKLGPFKNVTKTQLDEIARSSSTICIMEQLGILDRWLNTALLRYFISTSTRYDSPQRSIAEYWLQQYFEVLIGFCREFLVKNLPDEYHDQLHTPKIRQEHRQMLCVVYKHEFTNFTLADLLKEITFLEKALDIPPDVIKYLQTIPSNSVAVYWLFDMSYAAHLFFRVQQLFWPLLEHRVVSLELKDVITISLRGNHVSYLIKNALQTGQNLIQQTQVFVYAIEHMLLHVCAYSRCMLMGFSQ